MIEFMQNLGTWFINNLEIIKTVAMILSVIVTIVCTVVVLVYKKLVNKIDISVQDLTHIVDNYKSLMESVKELHTTVNEYDSTTRKSIDEMINVENIDAQILKKINSILDILGLAYSTVKNDDIRLGITNIVNYAKYLDPTNELLAAHENAKAAVENLKPVIDEAKNTSAIESTQNSDIATTTTTVTNKIRRW